MIRVIKKILYVVVLCGMFSCAQPTLQNEPHYQLIHVVDTLTPDANLEATVGKYRDSLYQEMNEILAFADTVFAPQRPCGNLNNWVADAVLVNQTKNVRLPLPVMCLLNFGGLRATINRGDVTLGDIYKVSPFDNKVMWAKMPMSVLPEIAAYLTQTGGHPIAGATLKNGIIHLQGVNEQQTEFLIITSDFLVNGGDKMYFFQKAIEITDADKFIRDCLIEEAKNQRRLLNNTEQRIELTESQR